MPRLVVSFLLLFVTNTVMANVPTLLVLGDSLSAGFGLRAGEGWVALLQKQASQQKKNWRIVNSSISGDTTSNGLLRLPLALSSHKPQIVVIELGGNDGLRGTPPTVIRQNLTQLVQMAKKSGAIVYVMEMRLPYNYGKKYVDAFTTNYRVVAEQENAILIPFFLSDVALQKELMQNDGIHPNAKAQPLMMKAIWKSLKW